MITDRRLFQIQPVFASCAEWMSLAQSEKLSYEVMDLSMPPVLNESRRYQVCEEWYRSQERTASLHGVFIDINPASADRDLRDLSRKRMLESCEAAVSVGAGNVVFHSSCCTFLRGMYLDAWAGTCAEFYEELAERFPLHFYVENSQDIDTGPLKELMRRISSPRVGVCLDIGHVNYSRMHLEKWFDDLGSRIGYLHLSDNMGQYDDHLPLGTGTVDWEKADRLWAETGRQMPVTLETGAVEGVRQSLRFLKEKGYFGYPLN